MGASLIELRTRRIGRKEVCVADSSAGDGASLGLMGRLIAHLTGQPETAALVASGSLSLFAMGRPPTYTPTPRFPSAPAPPRRISYRGAVPVPKNGSGDRATTNPRYWKTYLFHPRA